MSQHDPKDYPRSHNAARSRTEMAMRCNVKALQGTVNRYYSWNLSVFPIEQGKRILDLGCGPGLYLDSIMSYGPKLYMATDFSPHFLEAIESLSPGWGNCETCLVDLMSSEIPKPLLGKKFDYAICFDVLEHLQDDEKAMHNIRRIMIATRTEWLFLRVPALQFLYGKNDEAIGHFRRYSSRSLRTLLKRCSFHIHKMHYQNILGIFPWYLIGRVAGRSLAVSRNEGKIFNLIVPLLRVGESIISPPVGLSLYSICGVDRENLCFGEND